MLLEPLSALLPLPALYAVLDLQNYPPPTVVGVRVESHQEYYCGLPHSFCFPLMQKSYHTIGCAQKLGVSKSQLTKGMSLKEFDRPLCYKNNRTKNTPFYGGVLMNLNSYSWCSIKDDYRTLVGLESVNV